MHRFKLCGLGTRSFVPVVLLLGYLITPARSSPTTIIDNGPSANRVDIIFVGDGYTQADLDAGLYDQHMQSFLDHMFTTGGTLADPYPRYKNFFNVHKITAVSNESGADIPSESVFLDTALDATYDTAGLGRYLSISTTKADALRDAELAGTGISADVQLASVNHARYGGATVDGWSVYAGANSMAPDFELHEFGHAHSFLVDEYGGSSEPFAGPEPAAANVTKDATGQKWSQWLGFVDPRDASLTIGAFDGAAGYDHGLYRPSFNSKMRSLLRPFDAVSREAAILSIYEDVDPLDDWLDNAHTVIDASLWVEAIDPEIIRLEWYVDDVLIPGAVDEQFYARQYGFGPGTYNVRVRAYDEIVDHSYSGDLLDLVRRDLDDLEQSVTWTLTINPARLGDYNGNGLINSLDSTLWQATFGSSNLLAADGNNDATVDAADYVVWRKLAGAGGATNAGSIPEPATMSIAFAVAILWSGFKQRRAAI